MAAQAELLPVVAEMGSKHVWSYRMGDWRFRSAVLGGAVIQIQGGDLASQELDSWLLLPNSSTGTI